MSEVGKLPADRVVPVVKILGQRGDKAALPLLLEMAKKGEKDVRLEAIQSVGEIGDASAVPVLVELMQDKNDAIARAAATVVANLPGPEVDAAIVKILESPDPALRLKMLEIAGQRRVASAVPALLKNDVGHGCLHQDGCRQELRRIGGRGRDPGADRHADEICRWRRNWPL